MKYTIAIEIVCIERVGLIADLKNHKINLAINWYHYLLCVLVMYWS